MAYSEPTWNALHRIVDAVEKARQQLEAILGTDQIDTLLSAWKLGLAQLPEPVNAEAG